MLRSVILYLSDAVHMPVEETCLIRFADGTTHEYRIPVMNVQSYTLEMIELLGITCGHLLKNEPELKKEVHGIMRPIVMTQTERAEIINERLKDAIRKSIEKYCSSGRSRQEVKDSIQDIFSLDEAEAEEKMEKYWMQEDEQ